MKSRINKILEEIDIKKKELLEEYEKMRKKYNFEYIKGKIVFTKEQKEINKKKRKSLLKTIFNTRVRELLSAPFIYAMIFPFLAVDLFLFIYQNTAIRLYGIPLAKRSDYIKMDRKELDYLNILEKINCLYCSYVNGLIAYCSEVAGRTEKYWCPIKYASKKKGGHHWEKYFADFGDADGFREVYTSIDEYYEKNEEQGKKTKKPVTD